MSHNFISGHLINVCVHIWSVMVWLWEAFSWHVCLKLWSIIIGPKIFWSCVLEFHGIFCWEKNVFGMTIIYNTTCPKVVQRLQYAIAIQKLFLLKMAKKRHEADCSCAQNIFGMTIVPNTTHPEVAQMLFLLKMTTTTDKKKIAALWGCFQLHVASKLRKYIVKSKRLLNSNVNP